MSGNLETDLEAALGELARAEDAARPRPRPDLVARVLADAAGEAARRRAAPPAQAAAAVAMAGGRRRAGAGIGIAAVFGGLFRGPRLAALALAISLAGGVGAGYATAPEPVDPMLEALGEFGMGGAAAMPGAPGYGLGLDFGPHAPF